MMCRGVSQNLALALLGGDPDLQAVLNYQDADPAKSPLTLDITGASARGGARARGAGRGAAGRSQPMASHSSPLRPRPPAVMTCDGPLIKSSPPPPEDIVDFGDGRRRLAQEAAAPAPPCSEPNRRRKAAALATYLPRGLLSFANVTEGGKKLQVREGGRAASGGKGLGGPPAPRLLLLLSAAWWAPCPAPPCRSASRTTARWSPARRPPTTPRPASAWTRRSAATRSTARCARPPPPALARAPLRRLAGSSLAGRLT